MGLITKELKIKLNAQNIRHYRDLGYDCVPHDEITIPIEHLSEGSNYKIKVSCDTCGKTKNIRYCDYLRSNKNGDSCKKCNYEKSKLTKLERYGSISYYNIDSYRKTCLDKYGVDNFSKTEKFHTMMGTVPDDMLDAWSLYRRQSRRIVNKNKKKIFENWDGYDYYDNKYLKNNWHLPHIHPDYPTIDHKIPIYFGFMNNIPIEEINRLDNLVVTSRSNNSIKGTKKAV